MRNVHEVVEAANGKPILYFPARHDHWRPDRRRVGGARRRGDRRVDRAQASWWGGRGVGTVPHGLIAAYGGDTALAARKFADRFAAEMNVTVLVDFDNHSVVTALETADALGADLWGVRLDTSTSSRLRPAGATATTRLRGVPSWCGWCAPSSTRTAGRREIVASGGHRRPHPRVRSRERARRRLRRRLIADPRRQRLHRRRRDGRRPALRKVGREYRPNRA